jgi:hypothetical protein
VVDSDEESLGSGDEHGSYPCPTAGDNDCLAGLDNPEDEDGTSSAPQPTSGSKRKRSNPKKHEGIITKEAAMGMLSSLNMSASRMNDYVCAKVFNAFSSGMYFKFLAQCRAADEAWAFDVQLSISRVQKLSNMLSCVVSTVKQAEDALLPPKDNSSSKGFGSTPPVYGSARLSYAMACTMSSTSPPTLKSVELARAAVVRQSALGGESVRCCVTGALLEGDCLELKPSGKGPGGVGTTPAVLVRSDFEHFFSMLWFCFRIEHVIRQFAKCWMDDVVAARVEEGTQAEAEGPTSSKHNEDMDLGEAERLSHASTSLGAAFKLDADEASGESGGLNMKGLCEKFSRECNDTVAHMHRTFMHGYSHVLESLYAHQPVISFLRECAGGGTTEEGGSSGRSTAKKETKKRGTSPLEGTATKKRKEDNQQGATKQKAATNQQQSTPKTKRKEVPAEKPRSLSSRDFSAEDGSSHSESESSVVDLEDDMLDCGEDDEC